MLAVLRACLLYCKCVVECFDSRFRTVRACTMLEALRCAVVQNRRARRSSAQKRIRFVLLLVHRLYSSTIRAWGDWRRHQAMFARLDADVARDLWVQELRWFRRRNRVIMRRWPRAWVHWAEYRLWLWWSMRQQVFMNSQLCSVVLHGRASPWSLPPVSQLPIDRWQDLCNCWHNPFQRSVLRFFSLEPPVPDSWMMRFSSSAVVSGTRSGCIQIFAGPPDSKQG